MIWQPRESITVKEVQQLYRELGIPHFQRGLVWGNASVSALLESLFLNTPCGSFVFWEANNPLDFGERLSIDKGHDVKYLIVDGQQRIRTLVAALEDRDVEFEPDESETKETSDIEEKGPKCWCINLTRVEELADVLEPFGKDYSLFLRTTDPLFEPPEKDAGAESSDDAVKSARRSPLRHNIVPLRAILDSDQPKLRKYEALLRRSREPKDDHDKDLRWRLDKVYKGVEQILNRGFFVTIRGEQEVSNIVSLYIRINSGGKKVEAEERAFARLLDLDTGTYHHIARMFRDVDPSAPGEDDSPDASDLNRNDVMKRQKESKFGFKLFLRTFIQVCNYHFNRGTGKDQLAFGVVETANFARWMRETPPEDREFLWKETHAVVIGVRDLLRDELHCDELAFLPDATSLLPVFQLLIQFKELREKPYRSLMAGLGLLYLLADLETRDLLADVAEIKDRRRVAFDAIPWLWKKLQGRVEARIVKGKVLDKADSIQNRYVLLLYWLLRNREALDFSYENVPESPLNGQERKRLRRDVGPEKQHIVPFSRLVQALNETDARRGSSHPFNNIGNFTYISRELNGYKVGLGNKFVNLNLDEAPVLEAHFLANPAVRQAYDGLVGAMPKDGPFDRALIEKLFADFSGIRRAQIADALQEWLVRLHDRACASLQIREIDDLRGLAKNPSRIEAQMPRCVVGEGLRLHQRIPLFHYEKSVEDALVGYVAELRGTAVSRQKHALLVNLGEYRWVWLNLANDGIRLEFKSWVAEDDRNLLREELGMGQGVDLLYAAGSATVPIDLVDRLSKAAAVARARSKHVKEVRHEQLKALKGGRMHDFESSWSGHDDGTTLGTFNKFKQEMESGRDPEVRLDCGGRRPVFMIKLGGTFKPVLRAKRSPGWIRECLSSRVAVTDAGRLALAAFREALTKLEGASVSEKGVAIPVASCLAAIGPLKVALRELAARLSRREA